MRISQHRSTQRKMPGGKYDDDLLVPDTVALAQQYGRYGYRRITALLRDAGWIVNAKRVGLPARQPPLATPPSFA